MDGMSKEMTIPAEDLCCGDDSPVSGWVRWLERVTLLEVRSCNYCIDTA